MSDNWNYAEPWVHEDMSQFNEIKWWPSEISELEKSILQFSDLPFNLIHFHPTFQCLLNTPSFRFKSSIQLYFPQFLNEKYPACPLLHNITNQFCSMCIRQRSPCHFVHYSGQFKPIMEVLARDYIHQIPKSSLGIPIIQIPK